MSYLFTGRLRAHTCGGSVSPVANATLMLYRISEGEERGFTVRTPEDVRSHEYALIAQGRTDAAGEFSIDILEKSIYGHRGSTHPYAGESFLLDVVSRGADGVERGGDIEPVQFTVGAVNPGWSSGGERPVARWEHEINEDQWGQVRAALDTWSIVGQVGGPAARLGGLKVLAFDADLVQDDFIGSGVTDADGRFRIDYPGSVFRKTVVAGADVERGGPELYFRIEDASGNVVYSEPKSRGGKPDRSDAGNCFKVELTLEAGV